MNARQVGMVAAGLLILAAVVIGFVPVSRAGVNCGSVFTGVSSDAQVDDFSRAITADQAGVSLGDDELLSTSDTCSAAVSDRRAIALGIGVPGAVLLLGLLIASGVVAGRAEPTPRPEAETPRDDGSGAAGDALAP